MKIRENTIKTKLTFYSGTITGLSLGLIASPIWWIIDTIAIILSAIGATLTGLGSLLKKKEKDPVEVEPVPVEIVPPQEDGSAA